jgi:diguanylate cyclase (GGDEF)-like protein
MFRRSSSTFHSSLRRARALLVARRDRQTSWSRIGWLLLAAGVALSVVAGGFWRDQARDQANHSFDAQAASVGSSVTTALRRMDDLTVAARTVIASEPDLTNEELANWYRSVDAHRRYRGTLGFGFMALVPAAQLPRYVSQVRADPIPGVPRLHGDLTINPPGPRASYCLIRLGVAGIVNRLIPGGYGLDVCAIPGAGAIVGTRDTARFSAFSSTLATGERILTVAAPVYRGGVPTNIAQRRARMLGWVIGIFDVKAILGQAVAGDRGLAVTISRQDAASPRVVLPKSTTLSTVSKVASIGSLSGASLKRQFTLDADGRWVVTVAKQPDWGVLSPTVQGAALLLGGVLMTLLVFLLIHVLAQGRSRALRMVAEKTEELHHQALHDALTGLPNRALIMDRARQMCARSRRERTPAAALFIDVDNFKGVNDTFGHQVGDQLLRAVSARIRGVLRDSDTVGRLGGDEFVVLAEGPSLAAGPEVIADRIIDVLAAAFELDALPGTPLQVGASVGIAAGKRLDADDLLRDADIALYRAKETGKNRYVLFREEMHAAVHDRLALELDLRRALELAELSLVYQPTFDLARGTVTGVEALLRWTHPSRGLLLPDEFIPTAEETGVIVEIGRWVIKTACEQAAAWHASGFELDLSVNVSARQLDDPGLEASVREALQRSGLDPRFLVLEITETTLMRDADSTIERLKALKRLGVRIAIDDFGTGYSSFAYLRQFPVDAIKIDRTFISGIAASGEGKALLHTLVQLGKTLRLDTVAEGIEEHGQLRHLRAEECDSGQGFLLARPLEPEAVDSFLRRNWHRSGADALKTGTLQPRARLLGSEGV